MKLKITAILASLTILFSSCSDIFELEYPASDFPEWQTISDMEAMLMDEYDRLFSSGGWTANCAGNLVNYTVALEDLNQLSIWTAISNFSHQSRTDLPFERGGLAPDQAFANAYLAIRSCNTVITFVQDIKDGNIPSIVMESLSDAEIIELSRYNGESYFLRAYAYWWLAQTYMAPYTVENKDVIYLPYITSPIYSASDLLAPEMGTMAQIYDLMLSDLTIAKAELEAVGYTDTYIQDGYAGFANKYAASAMLMRIHFSQQNWQSAINECDYIISSGLYTLEEQPIRAFNRDITTPDAWHYAKEVIFEARYEDTFVANDVPFTLSRVSKCGAYNSYNLDRTDFYTNPNWEDGCRGVNWIHQNPATAWWNNWGLEFIGWIDEGESSNDLFEPNSRAYNDLRFTQLNCFLKAYEEGGDPTLTEQQFPLTTWNAVWSDKYLRGWSTTCTYLPLIRYPEILLTKASCLVQQGNGSSAATYVNEVAKRAYAPELTTPGSFETSDWYLTTATEEDVEKERIRELSWESGDRMRYIAAMKAPLLAHGKLDYYSLPSDGSRVGTEVAEIYYPYDNFHCALPDTEKGYSSTADQAGTTADN